MKWEFNGELPQNAKIERKHKGSINNVLKIIEAQLNNSGFYTCSVWEGRKMFFKEQGSLKVKGKWYFCCDD